VLKIPDCRCHAPACQIVDNGRREVSYHRIHCLTLLIFLPIALLSSSRNLCLAQSYMSVSDAISEALTISPLARAARFDRDAALARNGKDRPSARPTMQAVASGGVQGPRVTYPGAPRSDTTVLPEEVGRLDLIIEQPLYHAGARPARQRFDAQTALVDLEYRKALSAIAVTVRKLFVDLRRAESAARIAQDGADAAQRYYDLVQHLIDAGSARPVDLQTANGQLANAKAGLAEAESGLKLAKLAINQALGRPLNSAVSITFPANESDVYDGQRVPIDEAISTAQDHRPEIVELQIELAAAKSGVTLARLQSQPNLVARGQVTEQTPSAFVHEHYASAMLEIKLPILDNDKTRLDTREAEAHVKRLEALIEQAKSGAVLDIVNAVERIQVAKGRIDAAKVQVAASAAAETATITAYSVGRATAVDVQSASRELKLAKEKQTDANIDLLNAGEEFLQAQGTVPVQIDQIAPLPVVQDRKK